MLVTNHVLSGALLGGLLPDPASALGVGIASHFVLDSVPHWGDIPLEDAIPIAVTDGLLGLAAMTLLTVMSRRDRRMAVLAGMVGAAFPDLDKPSRYFFGRSCFPPRFDAFHGRIQRESVKRMPQEIVVGLSLLALSVSIAVAVQVMATPLVSGRRRRFDLG